MKEKVSRNYVAKGENHKKKGNQEKKRGRKKKRVNIEDGIFFEDDSQMSKEHSVYEPSEKLSNEASQVESVPQPQVHHLSYFNFLRLGDRVLRNMLDTQAFSEAMVLDAFYEEKRLNKTKCCNCFNSQCNKKYCECFKRAAGCTRLCKCKGCENVFGRQGQAVKVEMEESSQNNPQSAERIIKQLDKQEPYLNPYSS